MTDDIQVGDPVEVLFYDLDWSSSWAVVTKSWRPAAVVSVADNTVGVCFADSSRLVVDTGHMSGPQWRRS